MKPSKWLTVCCLWLVATPALCRKLQEAEPIATPVRPHVAAWPVRKQKTADDEASSQPRVSVTVYTGRTADDCPYCHTPDARATLRQVQSTVKDVRVVRVSRTASGGFSGLPRWVEGVPTYVVYRNGKYAGRVLGADADEIQSLIRRAKRR